MNGRSDIERVLQAWMADGPVVIPDRVVDVVATRIGVKRQRRPWPFPGRTTVTTQMKLIAGLAAAVVVAVVGWQFLPGTGGTGVPGTPTTAPTPSAQPTAAPTATPTAAPTAAARWPTWFTAEAIRDANGEGILSAGSHTTRVFNPGFTYTSPEGWVNSHDERDYFRLFPDTSANAVQFERSDGELAQNVFMGPHSNPWFSCDSLEDNFGTTAAEQVAAVTANEVLAVTGLVDVTIGGLTGKQFDVRRNPDWTGTCPGDSGLPAGVEPEGERTRVILLDTPGRGVLVIFMYSYSSAEHDAFIAEAMPIVESFQFGQ
jgi:hypothetical protein